ncbi:MAM and LDL-receptor class A domain-containing protein 1-like isoform X1 [Palaemon carinicauda]|uniref:MAM and LDL-receptor class A domain-containing protein 1-like isoform X1 n=2 Tax=Palaemon carinicauda TaxID=392227 RepID=UPI0035B6131E
MGKKMWHHCRLSLFAIFLWISSATSQDFNDCSFDVAGDTVSSCNLIMNTTIFGVIPWMTGKGDGAYFIGGPPVDNSGSAAGGYAFTSTTDMFMATSFHKKSWMLTGFVTNSTGATGRCLSFAYAMDGLSLSSFKIVLISYKQDPEEIYENGTFTGPIQTQNTVIWTQRDLTGGKWKPAKLTFTAPGAYSIAFAAEPNFQYERNRGYVAVDDIKFTDGPCGNECLFDSNTCSWENDEGSDDFNWSIGRSSSKRGTGPSRDQASSLDVAITTGGYAFIDSGYPRRTGDTARLVSSVLNTTSKPLCIKFWLNMHGGGVGDIRLLYASDNNPNVTQEIWKLWKDDGTTSFGTDSWYPCQQTVSSDDLFRLTFEASVGFPGAGDIALDTITFAEGSCPSVPPGSNTGWGDCNFLHGTCGWELPHKDTGSCSMLERVAESAYDPPGHTWNDLDIVDMYIKFDLGCYINQARDKAVLKSKLFTIDAPQCMSFWVFMTTTLATQTKFGALSVVLNTGAGKKNIIWRLQNEQQAGWTYAQVPVAPGTGMTVTIEGTKGPNLIGMIGVDDIAVYTSDCQVEPPQARVENADCTFDDGFCQYTIRNPDQGTDAPTSNWRFAYGDTLNVLRDHTFEADFGGFVFIDSVNTDLKSQLRSPKLSKNVTYCFTFYYASFYSDSGAVLSVFRYVNERSELLWRANQAIIPARPAEDQQVKWYYGQIALEDQATEFEVYIEGQVRVGGWAIDDIKLFTDVTECELRPPAASPVRF